MLNFVALYRGESLQAARLVAVTTDRELVAQIAAGLLSRPVTDESDPAIDAVSGGRREALRLIHGEAARADMPGGASRAHQTKSRPAPHARAAEAKTPSGSGAGPQKFLGRFGTLSGKRICAWAECARPFTPAPRQRGSVRRVCSGECRRAAWRARQRASRP